MIAFDLHIADCRYSFSGMSSKFGVSQTVHSNTVTSVWDSLRLVWKNLITGICTKQVNFGLSTPSSKSFSNNYMSLLKGCSQRKVQLYLPYFQYSNCLQLWNRLMRLQVPWPFHAMMTWLEMVTLFKWYAFYKSLRRVSWIFA